MTPTERGDLAERLLPLAAKLACVVHGDGDRHDVEHHTRQLDHGELVALTVLLAAMVDPDRRVDDALGHVTWDEHGHPAPAQNHGQQTIRGLASDLGGPETLGADMVVESERRLRARHLYLHDQLTVAEVARAVRARDTTVKRWIADGGWRQRPKVSTADWRPGRGAA